MTLNLPPNSFLVNVVIETGADIPHACNEMPGARCPGERSGIAKSEESNIKRSIFAST